MNRFPLLIAPSLRFDGRLIGYVQATIEARDRCWIAYVMTRPSTSKRPIVSTNVCTPQRNRVSIA
jgi:hypothetical protein